MLVEYVTTSLKIISNSSLVILLAIRNSLSLFFTTILPTSPLPRNVCKFYKKYLVLLGANSLLILIFFNYLVTNSIANYSLDRLFRLIYTFTKLTLLYNTCLASLSLSFLESAALVAKLP